MATLERTRSETQPRILSGPIPPSQIRIYDKNKAVSTSIGSLGHISPAGSEEVPNSPPRVDRAKGLIPIYGNSTEAVMDILRVGAYGIDGINGYPVAENAEFLKTCTRLAPSAIVSNNMISFLESNASPFNIDLEAIVPVNPSSGEDKLVFFGFNKPERRLTEEQEANYWRLLRGMEREISNAPDLLYISSRLRMVRQHGYEMHVCEGSDVQALIRDQKIDIRLLANLLGVTFGYKTEEAIDVLQRPTNIVTLAIKDGMPAGLCVIEREKVTIGGKTYKLAEVTDVVVADGINHGRQYGTHRGRSLYFAMTTHALARMIEFPGHTIWGEYTFTFPTAQRSSLRQGQELVGIRPSHTRIYGGMTTFAVMHVRNDEALVVLSRAVDLSKAAMEALR